MVAALLGPVLLGHNVISESRVQLKITSEKRTFDTDETKM